MKKKFSLQGQPLEIDIQHNRQGSVEFMLEGERFCFELMEQDQSQLVIKSEQGPSRLSFGYNAQSLHLSLLGQHFVVESLTGQRTQVHSAEGELMLSPMPGKVLKYCIKAQTEVKPGDPLVIMEAMKMEHTIKASSAGTVTKLLYKEGDLVTGGVELVEFKPAPKEAKK